LENPSTIAVITPLANEETTFDQFVNILKNEFDKIKNCTAYFIMDNVSKDRTLSLVSTLSQTDSRFRLVWSPENRNVVDAYIKGYKVALENNHELIIEMDSGLSHDPHQLRSFINKLQNGYDCVFGSRFLGKGSMSNTRLSRLLLSRGGTFLSNFLLGTHLTDMTSGYQGFRKEVVEKFLKYKLKSEGHFYQTELKYLLRKQKSIEIPITYQFPSKSVKLHSIINSLNCLFYYFGCRILFRPKYV